MKQLGHLALAWLLLATVVRVGYSQTESTYQRDADPLLGFVLVSYLNNDPDEYRDYLTALRELDQVGADHVYVVVYRRVNAAGNILEDTGSNYATVAYAIRQAKRLDFKVTVTPIFETAGLGWRGDWNPSGNALVNFRRSYALHVFKLARIAEKEGADVVNVGSEMSAFVNRGGNTNYLRNLVNRTSDLFSGEIGYQANWDNFDSRFVKRVFWDHPKIPTMSLSMYPHLYLANETEADDSANNGAFADTVKQRWRTLFEDVYLPYAAAQKGGAGMPITIGEFGAVPYNRCAAYPWNHIPSELVDASEQEAVIMGLIKAVDQKQNVIPEITVWQWGIGQMYDRFGINPFVESAQQPTAIVIWDFLLSGDDEP